MALLDKVKDKAAEGVKLAKNKIQEVDLNELRDNAIEKGKAIKDKVSEIDTEALKDSASKKAKELAETTKEKAIEVKTAVTDKDENYEYDKKKMNFQSLDSLQQVVNVVNEAAFALNDTTRTIRDSAIPEALVGAVGAGIGGVMSFAALYVGGSVVGLSAAGITSGLAAAGAVVGGGMAAGIFVLAAPVAALAGGGVYAASKVKALHLKQEKERLYEEALRKHEAIIQQLKAEADADKERLDYLQGINILLQAAIRDLQKDLGVA